MNAPISISLNFDSLNEAYGFPKNFRDPSFFDGFDRIEKIAEKYNFPLSIFIIGKDLENKEYASRVKEWHDKGHEIGNHSWGHLFNFALLTKSNLRDEVLRSHEKIFNTIGIEPKGFIAPAWATSEKLLNILIELNYEYDTSSFPSILLYPMITKIFFNHILNINKGIKILQRNDWIDPLVKPTKPYLVDQYGTRNENLDKKNILVLPLPTVNRFSACIWHTLGYSISKKFLKNQTEKLLDFHKGFYYVMHPADFLGSEDLDQKYHESLERMNIDLNEKLKLIDDMFSIFENSGRKMVTMRELAQYNRNRIVNQL